MFMNLIALNNMIKFGGYINNSEKTLHNAKECNKIYSYSIINDKVILYKNIGILFHC